MVKCPWCQQNVSRQTTSCPHCGLHVSYAMDSNSEKQTTHVNQPPSGKWPIKKMIPIGIMIFIMILLTILFLLLRNYNSPEAQARILINAVENNDASRVSSILSSKDNTVGPREAQTYIRFIKTEIGMPSFKKKVEQTVRHLEQDASVAAYVKTNRNQNVLRISKNGRRYFVFSNLGFQAPTKQAEVKPNVKSTYELTIDEHPKKIIVEKNQAVSIGNFIPGAYALDTRKTTERGTYQGQLKFNTAESKSNVVKIKEDFQEAYLKVDLKHDEALDDNSLKVVVNEEKLNYQSNSSIGPFPFDRDLKVYAMGRLDDKTFKTNTVTIKKDMLQSTHHIQLSFDSDAIESYQDSQEKKMSTLTDWVKSYFGMLSSVTCPKIFSQPK
ncbi:TcaA second domain-containing protein [Staphylococcus canis]|uniref:Teicoplanin resistance protein VanZ n=1 Tax=Staphylococcus canis TaxID=2724942 RepID=A0ABS0T6V8_9STAP|nr:teicoplanin resistance protein VanZ [Staphylococcus canis]MBI5974300.1 teicoplanin resistance protein VanZ [Staphylococcus canis]